MALDLKLSGKRYSASAEASRREELERIRRMPVKERLRLALALGRRRRELESARAAPRTTR